MLLKSVRRFVHHDKYNEIRQMARKERDNMVKMFNLAHKEELGRLSNQIKERIVGASLAESISLLNSKTVTSAQLVLVYADRIENIAMSRNYLASVMLNQAYQRAKECDRQRKLQSNKINKLWEEGNDNFPALFGVPISVKDIIHVKGVPTTIGCSSKMQPQSQNSLIVDVLQRQGAIMLVKGSTSQLGKTIQGGSRLWGRAEHPQDGTRSTGGSSGGDAGMVATRCVPGGIGTDLGGSLRIPAEFCKLVTLKSTNFRVQTRSFGQSPIFNEMLDANDLKGASGPLARSVQDAAILFRSMVNWEPSFFKQGQANPNGHAVKFNKQNYFSKQRLRVGVLGDGPRVMRASEAAKRGVRQAAAKLSNAGHTLIPVEDIPQAMAAYRLNIALNIGMGKEYFLKQLDGQQVQQELSQLVGFISLPEQQRDKIIRGHPDPRVRQVLKAVKPMSYGEYLSCAGEVAKIKARVAQWFSQFDVLLTPCTGAAPFKHATSKQLLFVAVNMMLWNVVEYPAGCLPITYIRQDQQFYNNKELPLDLALHNNLRQGKGFPVAVQVVGKPFQEQTILRVMKEIE